MKMESVESLESEIEESIHKVDIIEAKKGESFSFNERHKPREKEKAKSSSSVKDEPSESGFPKGLRILVVDDDPTCLVLVNRMLKSCNYEVTTCEQAEVALSMIREKQCGFDLVLTDVHMPRMDGFKLLELITMEVGQLPVVMMSIDCEIAVARKGLENGACFYLMKPVTLEELKNIWQHVVRKKRIQEQVLEHTGSIDSTLAKNTSKKKQLSVEQNELVEDVGCASSSIHEGEIGSSIKRKIEFSSKMDQGSSEDNEESIGCKRQRIVWHPMLHSQFLDAVNHLGFERAVPKKILEIMKVPGLTRENVASHLQKYRLFLRRLNVASHSLPSFKNFANAAKKSPFGPIPPNMLFSLQNNNQQLSEEQNLSELSKGYAEAMHALHTSMARAMENGINFTIGSDLRQQRNTPPNVNPSTGVSDSIPQTFSPSVLNSMSFDMDLSRNIPIVNSMNFVDTNQTIRNSPINIIKSNQNLEPQINNNSLTINKCFTCSLIAEDQPARNPTNVVNPDQKTINNLANLCYSQSLLNSQRGKQPIVPEIVLQQNQPQMVQQNNTNLRVEMYPNQMHMDSTLGDPSSNLVGDLNRMQVIGPQSVDMGTSATDLFDDATLKTTQILINSISNLENQAATIDFSQPQHFNCNSNHDGLQLKSTEQLIGYSHTGLIGETQDNNNSGYMLNTGGSSNNSSSMINIGGISNNNNPGHMLYVGESSRNNGTSWGLNMGGLSNNSDAGHVFNIEGPSNNNSACYRLEFVGPSNNTNSGYELNMRGSLNNKEVGCIPNDIKGKRPIEVEANDPQGSKFDTKDFHPSFNGLAAFNLLPNTNQPSTGFIHMIHEESNLKSNIDQTNMEFIDMIQQENSLIFEDSSFLEMLKGSIWERSTKNNQEFSKANTDGATFRKPEYGQESGKAEHQMTENLTDLDCSPLPPN